MPSSFRDYITIHDLKKKKLSNTKNLKQVVYKLGVDPNIGMWDSEIPIKDAFVEIDTTKSTHSIEDQKENNDFYGRPLLNL